MPSAGEIRGSVFRTQALLGLIDEFRFDGRPIFSMFRFLTLYRPRASRRKPMFYRIRSRASRAST
jgi:hypothetical protein